MQCRTNLECRMLMSCRSANDLRCHGMVQSLHDKSKCLHIYIQWAWAFIRQLGAWETHRTETAELHSHQPPTSAAAPDSSSSSPPPPPAAQPPAADLGCRPRLLVRVLIPGPSPQPPPLLHLHPRLLPEALHPSVVHLPRQRLSQSAPRPLLLHRPPIHLPLSVTLLHRPPIRLPLPPPYLLQRKPFPTARPPPTRHHHQQCHFDVLPIRPLSSSDP